MKSTMTDQDLIDASAPALRGQRHGMKPEHFAQPMLDSMHAIADAAVTRAVSERKVPPSRLVRPDYETMIRDEFAGRAIPGLLAAGYTKNANIAGGAYRIADAMMEARDANR